MNKFVCVGINYITTSLEVQILFFEKDDANSSTKGVEYDRRKCMQLLPFHVETNLTRNGCKNITHYLMCPRHLLP
jgi:hypothetical protein